jgi:DNA mismatch endonuclease (patch repair protein)
MPPRNLAKSAEMSRVRTRDTELERIVRRMLFAKGVRYRLHVSKLPGSPDIYISRLSLAIFVNGCFWHGHTCHRGKAPTSNVDFWRDKLARNVRRDAQNIDDLLEMGITSIVVWGCSVGSFAATASKIAAAYRRKGS